MFGKKLEADFAIEGLHCKHCMAKVENAIKAVKGVKKFEVDLEGASAHVVYEEGKTSPDEIAAAISASGFGARIK